ncbi:hypothetical protein F5148DRAFT_1283841 [Russula earlei]|uniref:Uncharacterized protein n=1 Tax=Russula earlei TaxID=71964 RepID=A0ACC0UB89_9AGAM|nr:hypothetical protein F5148DRAFT_1283841 [Russula earlei]
MVPLSPILTSPQPPPPKGWEPSPSPSNSSTTPLASPQDAHRKVQRTLPPNRLQLQELANGGVTAPPPGSFDIGMGMYPSGMSGSTAFDYPLRILGEDPETFMSDPTENVSPSSTDVETVEQTQGSDLDDFVKDFGVTTSQEDTEGASTPGEFQHALGGRYEPDAINFPPSSNSHYMPSRDAANSSNRRVGGS